MEATVWPISICVQVSDSISMGLLCSPAVSLCLALGDASHHVSTALGEITGKKGWVQLQQCCMKAHLWNPLRSWGAEPRDSSSWLTLQLQSCATQIRDQPGSTWSPDPQNLRIRTRCFQAAERYSDASHRRGGPQSLFTPNTLGKHTASSVFLFLPPCLTDTTQSPYSSPGQAASFVQLWLSE